MEAEVFRMNRGRLFLIPPMAVHWGGYSQIRCELRLLQAAVQQGPHAYYHLLTGATYPLKSQAYIHRFFQEHAGEEFISIDPHAPIERVQYIFLFNEAGKLSDTWIDKKKYIWRRKYLDKQKSRGTDRFRQYQMEFRKGLAYWSITQELAGYILSRKKLIRKMFRFSLCGDEVFMQILAYNSPFRDRIYTSPGVEGQCLRCSTWPLEDRGVRRTGHNFYVQDLNWLLESEDLFALKFEGEAGTWLMGHIRSRYEDE